MATNDGVSPAAPTGIDPVPLARWLTANIDGMSEPFEYELIAGGHSNLTFLVTDRTGRRVVLRRPPTGQVLPTAHDMEREHKIISALAVTDVPVAPALGLCLDAEVNGAPFYVMEYVEGQIIRGPGDAESMSEEMRQRASRSLMDVLARIHAVDIDSVGLADLGRHDGYIERQLKRWHGQYLKSAEDLAGRGITDLAPVHEWLVRNVPAQQWTAIVHGDYRLDNVMLDEEGNVTAVLDWEICTLGDPLADLGLLMVYWPDPGEEAALAQTGYLTKPGFPRRSELLDFYREFSGTEAVDIDFYIAFGYWKLGCIIAGVYARYAGGSMGDQGDSDTVAGFHQMLNAIASLARASAERLGASW